jgi:hypothetical protein
VLLGIFLWTITKDPLSAVVIAAIVDCVAFIPTFRKAYLRPAEESLSVFSFDIAKFALSIAALGVLSPTTALFPAVSGAANVIFVTMVLLRRRRLSRVSRI